ncbi:MAG: helix-turn-helix domain-containing protein, partial [Candidatus Helarchaeota archaeon]|nr:helix-turn-helix domain-containing protein [Candidatus Helarchaeota archaeon]
KVSEISVSEALYTLVKQKLIMPCSALTRAQILENPSRALIYQAIQKQPGIHMRELCQTLEKSIAVILAHLKVLENFDFIRKKRYTSPKFISFFLKDFPETYDDYFIMWKNENSQRILKLLSNQELTLTELASQLAVHHSTVQYHLDRLENFGFIIRTSGTPAIKYTFNQTKLKPYQEFVTLYSNSITSMKLDN